MMVFENKTVLILSQQDWGTMFLSKHHYAVELGKMGNHVYYIEGPNSDMSLNKGEVKIFSTEHPNVYYVKHRLSFPLFVKFKLPAVYNFLITRHIKKLIHKLPHKVDAVISFDISNTLPLPAFGNCSKILIAADDSKDKAAVEAAKGASAVLSIAKEYLVKYEGCGIPLYNLGHGVASYFINDNIDETTNDRLQIGLSGNFLRRDLDRDTMLHIFRENPEVDFNLWGSYDYANSNLASGNDADTLKFIDTLKQLTNVHLHGQILPRVLAEELKKMDGFLICYDIDRDQSGGTNYHKVLEYLATGKVIVSNNITTYDTSDRLIEMPAERNNVKLPTLFKEVVANIPIHNAAQEQQRRIAFAKDHSYISNLQKIASFL